MPGTSEMVADRTDSYRLHRAVGLVAVVASAVAGEYGAGINFVATQSLSVYPAAAGLVPLAMMLTGLVLITKTTLFASFARELPRAGSAYVWIGRTMGVPAGFIVSFLWWISVTAAMGFIAFAFSTFLSEAVNGIGLDGAVLTTHTARLLLGLAAIWGIFAIHASGVHHYGRFVSVLFALIVIVAAVITGYGFATSPEHFLALASQRANLTFTPPANTSAEFTAFVSVCSLFIFAYGGISAAPALGGEARDPSRTMARGVVLGWATAVVLYSAVALALFHAAPWWAVITLLKSKHASLATAPGLVALVAPRWLGVALEFAVALIVGKTLAPQMMITSRLAFAWAQDGLLPETFARTSAGRRAPVPALLLIAVLASFFLAESVYVGWALGVVIRSISLLLVWLLLALATLKLRFEAAPAGGHWTAALARSNALLVAAVVSIPIVLGLLAAVAVVPHTAWMFQPLFQTVVAALIAGAILALGASRLRQRGDSLLAVRLGVPVE